MVDRRWLSKKMSYALRHNPDKYGLSMDVEGWVSVQELLAGINRVHNESLSRPVTEADLIDVIEHADKRRFAMREGEICALYGHSIPMLIHHEKADPPAVLFHGTSHQALESIRQEGLRPMSRQYVHLSTDREMAESVGRRHDAHPVILVIDAAAAQRDGIAFYRGNERVWLCDALPARYLSAVEERS